MAEISLNNLQNQISGKANSSHTHDASQITGTINASTATKLSTARTITLTGDVSGSASFDGSANISITTTVNNSSIVASSGSVNYAVAGTYTFTVPENVYLVKATVVGGGGGGGAASGYSGYTMGAGGGGAGAAYVDVPCPVTPGQQITVVVGTAGAIGAGATAGSGSGSIGGRGGTGGTSSFGSFVSALGGQGGYQASATTNAQMGGSSGGNLSGDGETGDIYGGRGGVPNIFPINFAGARRTTAGPGNNAISFGSGGGGGKSPGQGINGQGGAGFSGIVMISW